MHTDAFASMQKLISTLIMPYCVTVLALYLQVWHVPVKLYVQQVHHKEMQYKMFMLLLLRGKSVIVSESKYIL